MKALFNQLAQWWRDRRPLPEVFQGGIDNDLSFADYLDARCFQEARVQTELLFSKLGLPTPEPHEFLRATSGALVFVNKYSFLVRIERSFGDESVNDNPWVLQPFGAMEVKGDNKLVVIEICPGVFPARKDADLDAVVLGMEKCGGFSFEDRQVANVGILPYKIPAFPRGVPVVIDRPSAHKLSRDIAPIKKALDCMGIETDPQKILYGDIQQAWKEAFKNGIEAAAPEKIKNFLDLCAQAKADGRAIDGWNARLKGGINGAFYKQHIAKCVAGRYAYNGFPK